MLFCIGKGFVSGLQEALATEGLNATAIAFTTAVGIAITAGMAVLPATIVAIISTVAALLSIISASFMAAQAVEMMVRCSKAKLNRYSNLYEVLEQKGITLDQFDKLKLKNVDTMLEEEPYNIKILQKIWESIPNPTSETCLRKTIPYGKMFQGGKNTDKAPCTRNGFLGSTNGEIILE